MPVVYLLTNPAMPNLVKIGITEVGIEQRLRQLSAASGVPVAFECFMAIEVPAKHLTKLERALHLAFADSRVNSRREFFEVSPDRPAAILQAFRDILGPAWSNVTPRGDVVDDPEEQVALDSERNRGANFRFGQFGILPGSVLHSVFNPAVTAEVIDDRRVRFRGEDISLSGAALIVAHETGRHWASARGPQWWTHNGKSLLELRDEN